VASEYRRSFFSVGAMISLPCLQHNLFQALTARVLFRRAVPMWYQARNRSSVSHLQGICSVCSTRATAVHVSSLRSQSPKCAIVMGRDLTSAMADFAFADPTRRFARGVGVWKSLMRKGWPLLCRRSEVGGGLWSIVLR
jgi:hypothetical protein